MPELPHGYQLYTQEYSITPPPPGGGGLRMLVGPNAVSILGMPFRFTVSADKRKRLKAIWTRMNSDEHGL